MSPCRVTSGHHPTCTIHGKRGMRRQLTSSSSSRGAFGVALNPVVLSPVRPHCSRLCPRPQPRKALSLAVSKELIFGYSCAE